MALFSRNNSNSAATDDAFIARVAEWIAETGEVFVHLRFSHAAGIRRYAFCRSEKEFRLVVADVPTATDVIVFRQPQLPWRGTVTEDFILKVLSEIPDSPEFPEYLIVDLEPTPDDVLLGGCIAGSHDELLDELQDFINVPVAIGFDPAWHEADNADMISARKDGVIGTY